MKTYKLGENQICSLFSCLTMLATLVREFSRNLWLWCLVGKIEMSLHSTLVIIIWLSYSQVMRFFIF